MFDIDMDLLSALETAAESLELTANFVLGEGHKGTAEGISNDAKQARLAADSARVKITLHVKKLNAQLLGLHGISAMPASNNFPTERAHLQAERDARRDAAGEHVGAI